MKSPLKSTILLAATLAGYAGVQPALGMHSPDPQPPKPSLVAVAEDPLPPPTPPEPPAELDSVVEQALSEADAAKVMHLYNDLEINCWGYLTPPPYGDVNLDDALRVMRPDMALRGNVDQVAFMIQATPAEVREKVRDLLLKVKPRGNWILSTTDFFFDGRPYENIRAFGEAGLKYGEY